MDPHLYPPALMATPLHPCAPQMDTTELLQHRQLDPTQSQVLPRPDHSRATDVLLSSSSLARLPARGLLLLNNNSRHRLARSLEMEGLVPPYRSQTADQDPKSMARHHSCARSIRLRLQVATIARAATVASAVRLLKVLSNTLHSSSNAISSSLLYRKRHSICRAHLLHVHRFRSHLRWRYRVTQALRVNPKHQPLARPLRLLLRFRLQMPRI